MVASKTSTAALKDSTARLNGKTAGGVKKGIAKTKQKVSAFAAAKSRRQSTARPKKSAVAPSFKGTSLFGKDSIYSSAVVTLASAAKKQLGKAASSTQRLSEWDRRQSTAVPRKKVPVYSFGSGSARFGKDSIYPDAVVRFNLRPRPQWK